ncbi:hypothetical protein LshimejAT787_0704290 [Lyophyllum shimeji]|uniref:Uncharacterized protein n=1 Tax=Lyophyllum shimeji TaxID=47721 RepID=A0A9P3PQV2_LYOSH|nr:hypothetical protein LshimejAT787_0704290 [Lyophyllum shimeji]
MPEMSYPVQYRPVDDYQCRLYIVHQLQALDPLEAYDRVHCQNWNHLLCSSDCCPDLVNLTPPPRSKVPPAATPKRSCHATFGQVYVVPDFPWENVVHKSLQTTPAVQPALFPSARDDQEPPKLRVEDFNGGHDHSRGVSDRGFKGHGEGIRQS